MKTKIFYKNVKKGKLPIALNRVQVDETTIKEELRTYLSENEGSESLSVFVYDEVLEDNESTLFDYFEKYLNNPVFKVHIIEPVKGYNLDNVGEVNIHIEFKKDAWVRSQQFKNKFPNYKIHLTDNLRYISIDSQHILDKNEELKKQSKTHK